MYIYKGKERWNEKRWAEKNIYRRKDELWDEANWFENKWERLMNKEADVKRKEEKRKRNNGCNRWKKKTENI